MHVTDVFTDGNIIASAKDIAKWAQELGNARLLSRESLSKMFHDYGAGYGYGWNVETDATGRKLISHSGGWVGYASFLAHSMNTGESIAYILNQEMSERQEEEFKRRLQQIVFSE